jgi:hypothetical protein
LRRGHRVHGHASKCTSRPLGLLSQLAWAASVAAGRRRLPPSCSLGRLGGHGVEMGDPLDFANSRGVFVECSSLPSRRRVGEGVRKCKSKRMCFPTPWGDGRWGVGKCKVQPYRGLVRPAR